MRRGAFICCRSSREDEVVPLVPTAAYSKNRDIPISRGNSEDAFERHRQRFEPRNLIQKQRALPRGGYDELSRTTRRSSIEPHEFKIYRCIAPSGVLHGHCRLNGV